jgi:hypothetical protein
MFSFRFLLVDLTAVLIMSSMIPLTVNLRTRYSLKMSKNMNKRKSAPENSILKFPTVSSMSSDSNVHDCIISVQVRSEFGKFAYTAICMRNVYTLI